LALLALHDNRVAPCRRPARRIFPPDDGARRSRRKSRRKSECQGAQEWGAIASHLVSLTHLVSKWQIFDTEKAKEWKPVAAPSRRSPQLGSARFHCRRAGSRLNSNAQLRNAVFPSSAKVRGHQRRGSGACALAHAVLSDPPREPPLPSARASHR